MNRLIFSLLLMLLFFPAVAQQKLPFMNYYESTVEETKNKLQEYLNHFRYNGSVTDTDSTVNIVVTQEGKEWTIFSSFHFDKKGLCDFHTTSRCDKFKELALNITLKNKMSQWVRVDENKYLSNYNQGELLEVLRTDSCIFTKFSPVMLTRKELRIKRREGYKGISGRRNSIER